MTKKDFIKVAEILKHLKQTSMTVAGDDTEYVDFERIQADFIHMLKTDNTSFDQERFINYINE